MASLSVVRLPRSRNRELTRERLLEAARDSFCSRGFENTSLRDIANAVGVNHALIKYYFEDKDTLWREAVSDLMRQFTKETRTAMEANPPKDDASHMRIAITAFIRFWGARREATRMVYWACMEDNERMRWLTDTFLKAYHNLTIRDIERWQKAGIIANGDSTICAYAIAGMVFTPLVMASEIRYCFDRDMFSDDSINRMVDTILALLTR